MCWASSCRTGLVTLSWQRRPSAPFENIFGIVISLPCVSPMYPPFWMDRPGSTKSFFTISGDRANSAVGMLFVASAQAIDTAILFPNSFRAALIAALAGCKRRVGYARYCRNMLLTDRLSPRRGPQSTCKPTPMIDDYNRLVQKIGVSCPSVRMELFTTPADEPRPAKFGIDSVCTMQMRSSASTPVEHSEHPSTGR